VRTWAVLLACFSLVACAGDEEAAPTPATVESTTEETTTEATTTEGTSTEREPGRGQGLRLVEIASGFESPTHVAAAPGEPDRLYVVERSGRIRVLEGGRILPEPFLDVSSEVTSGGEQGLLSVAFHPKYERNGLFYVDYTALNGDNSVVEYRAGEGGTPRRERQLLAVKDPYSNHNGGQLAFGPDGLLYVGMGDGGSGGDPENRAQNLDSQLGKLLRIDVDRRGAGWRIAAYGLRNPWRFSFDREVGDLYIADVGQGSWEEIDYLPEGERELVNFGWDVFEGTHSYEDKEPNSAGRLREPLLEYDHSLGCSVTGGHVYRGERLESAYGRYFYGDYCSGIVWSVVVRDGKATDEVRHSFEVPALSSFGEDARGELLLVSLDGVVYRLDAR
jgi:glucose/arabinose dehydrogenase